MRVIQTYEEELYGDFDEHNVFHPQRDGPLSAAYIYAFLDDVKSRITEDTSLWQKPQAKPS